MCIWNNLYNIRSRNNLQEKVQRKKNNLGIYVHVPFCGSVCDFCAFYQEKPHRSELEKYLEGIKKELELRVPRGVPLETMFWGGGTPGLLPAKDIAFMGQAILDHVGNPPKEWTVEMAPATVKEDKLQVMKELGVNRISMGVQSFNEAMLKGLGRLHSPKQVYKAYELIREAGFDNVNLDMMFALPGQQFEDWVADLKEAQRLGPEHLSTYCLTFEEDTALFVKLSQGKVKIDIEKEAHFYKETWKLMADAGYEQYEVSNFAKPGHACAHNIDTWRMQEWIGLGPSAASQYAGTRQTNVANIREWLEGLESGELKTMDHEVLDEGGLAGDSMIFGLRMNPGVDLEELKERFPAGDWANIESIIDELAGEGLVLKSDQNVRLTDEGRILADAVGERFLG